MPDELQDQLQRLEMIIDRVETLFARIERPGNLDFDARFEARRLAHVALRELRGEFRQQLRLSIQEARKPRAA